MSDIVTVIIASSIVVVSTHVCTASDVDVSGSDTLVHRVVYRVLRSILLQ